MFGFPYPSMLAYGGGYRRRPVYRRRRASYLRFRTKNGVQRYYGAKKAATGCRRLLARRRLYKDVVGPNGVVTREPKANAIRIIAQHPVPKTYFFPKSRLASAIKLLAKLTTENVIGLVQTSDDAIKQALTQVS